MSNAAHQAQRANARESAATNSNAPTTERHHIPRLRPNDDEIRSVLEGKKIAQVDEKYKAVESIYNGRTALAAFLNDLPGESSLLLDQIDWNDTSRGFPKKQKFNAKSLANLLCDVWNALVPILPSTVHHNSVPTVALKKSLKTIDDIYKNARAAAATDLQALFSSQFITLRGPDRDRKYLQNGYLPSIPALRRCLCCGHDNGDEPNENIARIQRNNQKKAAHNAQIESDKAAWASGQEVRNARNEVMTEGRKRPDPKYETIIIVCHCEEFSCTTGDGPVPTDQCPIRCIDPSTGNRYSMDINGSCTCPICLCECSVAFTVSHAVAYAYFVVGILTFIIFLSRRLIKCIEPAKWFKQMEVKLTLLIQDLLVMKWLLPFKVHITRRQTTLGLLLSSLLILLFRLLC